MEIVELNGIKYTVERPSENECILRELNENGETVNAEREQKIKEVARVLYDTLAKQFETENKELTADVIIEMLNNNKDLRDDVLNGVLNIEYMTEKQPELCEEITRDYLDNTDVDEVNEEVVERIGKYYVEENAYDILHDSYNSLNSYEQKEFVKDCIDDF